MYVYTCMSVCAYVHVGKILQNKKSWTIYGVQVLIQCFIYEPHELPRHKKICFRGLRPGCNHKSGFTAKEASWRLEFGFKEGTSTSDFAVAQ